MNVRKWAYVITTVLIFIVVTGWLLRPNIYWTNQVSKWQQFVKPGKLSAAHSDLEDHCAACHTSVEGVEAAKCIACHANNEPLLMTQSTSFHASINNCKNCHLEHQGYDRFPTNMDHVALVFIGLRKLANYENSDTSDEKTVKQLVSWINQASDTSISNSKVRSAELLLNCAACHSDQGPHVGYFGNNCASCHSTHMWTIPNSIHPAEISKDCAQCHKAPDGHYESMFNKMRSNMFGKEHVAIYQCYECHKISSWSDIKGLPRHKSMHSPER